jgi:hypothetical protein
MDELPHRPVVDLQPTLSELIHKPPQGEISALDPLQQPQPVLTRNRLRLVTSHLARLKAAGFGRLTQLMAVLTPIPNCFAARLQDIPPVLTAAITRSRRSIE